MTHEIYTATGGARETPDWAAEIDIKQRRLDLEQRLGVPFLHGARAELMDEIMRWQAAADLLEAHRWRRRQRK